MKPGKLRKQLAREKAERYLGNFLQGCWPIVEPAQPLQNNWHMEYICEYLAAVREGSVKRLILNIPPRHTKSLLVTVSFPAWVWTRQPEKRFIKVSYAETLSKAHNQLARDIILSPWYRENWGHLVQLKGDANRQQDFQNTAQGQMYATSIGGTLTGQGGDCIIIDDPQNPKMANSDVERAASIAFFQNTLQTRLNNPDQGSIILVMQRLHEQDLTGYILQEQLGYHHVCLPTEAPHKTVVTFPKSGRVLVREAGSLLNEARFSREALAGMKKAMGSAQYAGQMNQSPVPAGGIIFKGEWLQHYYGSLPAKMSLQIQSWDLPFLKSEGSAKCAGLVMGLHQGDIYILDMVNEKMEFTESVDAIRKLSQKYPETGAKVVEDKANGPAVVSLLRKEIPGMVPFHPKGGKAERAISVTPYFEGGHILLPDPAAIKAPWLWDFVEELKRFPKSTYKDVVDAVVQGVLYLYSKPATSLPAHWEEITPPQNSYWV